MGKGRRGITLLDTNSVIYFLSDNTDDEVIFPIEEAIGNRPPKLSVITEVELLC